MFICLWIGVKFIEIVTNCLDKKLPNGWIGSLLHFDLVAVVLVICWYNHNHKFIMFGQLSSLIYSWDAKRTRPNPMNGLFLLKKENVNLELLNWVEADSNSILFLEIWLVLACFEHKQSSLHSSVFLLPCKMYSELHFIPLTCSYGCEKQFVSYKDFVCDQLKHSLVSIPQACSYLLFLILSSMLACFY